MYKAFAIRPFGTASLFNPGGNFDKAFYTNVAGAEQYISDVYPTAGDYQSNVISGLALFPILFHCYLRHNAAFTQLHFHKTQALISCSISIQILLPED